MRRLFFSWKSLIALLATGTVLPSCGTDARDAAVTGIMDAISGGITDSIQAAIPLADWITQNFGT